MTMFAAAIAAGLVAAPIAGAAEMDGAPTEAKVRLQSQFALPAAAYSLICTGLSGCSTSGQIDLATTAEVPVKYSSGATQGVAPMPFSLAQGAVARTFTCEGSPEPFVSRVEVDDTISGELEIAKVAAEAGQNTLAVVLNHGGKSGGDFPQEIIDRSDGGCDAPVQNLTQTMGQWYYHFYIAHRDEQQEAGNDLELKGLAYDDGTFTKTFNRTVNVGTPANFYPVDEVTRIEVEPRWCRGQQNRISSATADGESMGLDGSRFYPGQVITAPAKARIRLGDGSAIELEKGGRYRVERCEENLTEVYLGESVRNLISKVKRAVGGSKKKFEITTERAVAGVRGTVFSTSYDKPKQLTKIAVRKGSVSLKGINGARGKVIVRAGQVGIQKGKKAPRIGKR